MSVDVPIPNPNYMSFNQWAVKLTLYLQSLEDTVKNPAPKIAQLEHVLSLADASAVKDGVIFWSTEQSAPVVSLNNRWYKLTMTLIP